MISEIILQTGSPQWWLVGWVLSIVLLAIGLLIGVVYYDVSDEPARDRNEGDLM